MEGAADRPAFETGGGPLSYMLFPVNGSHFDMELGGPVMALTAAIVTVVWGPGTLARWRQS